MKKIFSILLIGFCAILTAKAEVEFSYEAGAEVVSAYLWRGQYNGGLSLQPSLAVGFEGEHTSFSVGAWGSVGASDWGFRKGLDENENGDPNTYFLPELDLTLSFSFFGITLGATHYYYCDGSNFGGWKNPVDWESEDWSTSSTEVQIGFNCSEFLPENHNLYANWYTMVSGADFKYDDNDEIIGNNYSSYIELGYDYTFDKIGLTLGGQIGMVPWTSDFYGTEGFAVKNLSLKINKAWEMDLVEIDLFAQGMIDSYDFKDNIFVKGSGDDKLYNQKLNGCIGLGIWF